MMFSRLFVIAAASVAASCAAPEETKREANVTTVKPGANVGFSHALRAPVSPGGAGVLELVIDEKYDSGAMRVSASSTTLDLASASSERTIALNGQSSHRWDIFFKAGEAGVHYIDVMAVVEGDNGASATRSYSADVVVGDSKTVAAKSKASMATDASGEPMVVMEAEETTDE